MQRGMEMGDAPRAPTQIQPTGFSRLILGGLYRLFNTPNNNEENLRVDVPLNLSEVRDKRS